MILLRKYSLLCIGIIKHSRPIIVAGRNGGAQSNSYLFKTKPLYKLFCNTYIALMVQFPAFYICAFCLNSEDILYYLYQDKAEKALYSPFWLFLRIL